MSTLRDISELLASDLTQFPLSLADLSRRPRHEPFLVSALPLLDGQRGANQGGWALACNAACPDSKACFAEQSRRVDRMRRPSVRFAADPVERRIGE